MKGFGSNFESFPLKKSEEPGDSVDILEQQESNNPKNKEFLEKKLQDLKELEENILERHNDKEELPSEVVNFLQTLKKTQEDINRKINE